jgi:hypothetical protein
MSAIEVFFLIALAVCVISIYGGYKMGQRRK